MGFPGAFPGLGMQAPMIGGFPGVGMQGVGMQGVGMQGAAVPVAWD